MGKKGRRERAKNIYFRQTPREFRSAKYAQVVSHFQRLTSFNLFRFSRRVYVRNVEALKGLIQKGKEESLKRLKSKKYT